uniref:Uncharacterized protein n=1 Tax=Anguilla anguilla TaxID=7936 RepID=A0A0E9VNB5_ANGAN
MQPADKTENVYPKSIGRLNTYEVSSFAKGAHCKCKLASLQFWGWSTVSSIISGTKTFSFIWLCTILDL